MAIKNISAGNNVLIDIEDFLYRIKVFRIGFGISVGLIFILGFLGNLSVIVTIVKSRRNKTLMYYLILNLAIYDILVVLTLPLVTTRNLLFYWPFGWFLCFILRTIIYLLTFGSISTMVAISIDRYLVVLHATSPIRRKINKKLVTVIVFVWSLIITIPFIVFTIYDTSLPALPQCYMRFSTNLEIEWVAQQIFSAVVFGLLFACPLLVVSVVYYRLLMTLRQRSKENDAGISPTYAKAIKKTIKMALIINTTFILCWIPWYLCLFITIYNRRVPLNLQFHYYVLLAGCHTVSFLHSVINPIIYASFMQDFRRPLLQLNYLMQTFGNCFINTLCTRLCNNSVNP